jgi:Right handed beta helix region
LDLNGFALTASGAGNGIILPTMQTNVTVRNGSVSGWAYGVFANNVLLEHLTVSSCSISGIRCTGPAQIRNCICTGNSNSGILVDTGGLITDCIASGNGNYGIQASHSIVRNCRAANNGQSGIYISTGAVSGCLAENNILNGIYVNLPGTEVIGNVCSGNNSGANAFSAGIYVNDSNNRIEDNHVTANGYAGISVNSSYSGNLVVKNFVSGNGANNYLTPGNQVVGPLITTTGTISSSNPWANFSF